MANSRKAVITVTNHTATDMQLKSQNLMSGEWVTSPPQTIPAGASTNFQSEGKGFLPTGTSGSVTYTLADNATVILTFDNPFIGSDSASISCSPENALNVSFLQSGGDQDQIAYDVFPFAPPPKSPIQHVFVLMLENRSFDHMLGFSGIQGPDAENLQEMTAIRGLTGTESNTFNGTPHLVSQPADDCMPDGPGHEFTDVIVQLCGEGAQYPPGAKYPAGAPYPAIDSSGFVANYFANGGAKPAQGLGEIMKCFHSATQLPVLYTLAQTFAVCDQWYASMPGPTWPNRFFAVAASSGGLDHSPATEDIAEWMSVDGFTFEHGHIFDLLRSKNVPWRIYRGDEFPVNGALKGITILDTTPFDDFANDVADAKYQPAFTFIEPNYGDFASGTYLGGNSQHPIDDVTKGEALIKTVYEALRASPIWTKSLLIVTWDEHGGFYDHWAPVSAPPPGDKITAPVPHGASPINEFGFNFAQYGVRVPAVVVSAYTPGCIDHRKYDHSSIPATVEVLLGLPAMTDRDAVVNNVLSLVTPNQRDAPMTLPNPATSNCAGANRALVAQAVAAKAAPSPESDNLPGFLHVAMRNDLALSPAAQHPAIVARVKAIQTRTEAAQYIEEVRQKVRAADAARGR